MPISLSNMNIDTLPTRHAATYRDILSLRPRWPAIPSPPSSSVCSRLRELGVWAVCRLIGRIGRLRHELRRGLRSGVRCHQLASATDTQSRLSTIPQGISAADFDIKTSMDKESNINTHNTGIQVRQLRSVNANANASDSSMYVGHSSSKQLTALVTETADRRVSSYCLLNVRSLSSKLDDVIALRRDNSVSVVCLVETWHDVEDVSVRRLRALDFTVVDRPRTRIRDDLTTNYGGILVFAPSSIRLSVLPIQSPSSFELLCVCITTGRSTEIVVVVYRPGSQPLQQQFFDELSVVFERVATYSAPVYVVGDFNIRLDRPNDPSSVQFRSLLESFGFTLAATGPTHARGGTLDAIASTVPIAVDVIDAGISDHHAVRWSSTDSMTSSSVHSVAAAPELVRSWRRLDTAALREAMSGSCLCQSDSWPTSLDDLCSLYDAELTTILDQLLPLHTASVRRRPSDPWFDRDCRQAKISTRRLERAYAAATRCCSTAATPATSGRRIAAAAAAKAAWYSQRRSYRQLRYQKCQDFWRERVETDRANPRQLWQTIDRILGRCNLRSNDSISVEQYGSFFTDKVRRVRDSTADSSPPTFSDAPAGVSLSAFTVLSVADVAAAIRQLPDKSSAADPIPTAVLKSIADLIAPYITELFNRSLAAGQFPSSYKHAFITPIVKKAGLDAADVSSYRPISNLPVLSKLLERVVLRQLLHYLNQNDLLPPLQSGFRPGHSTETAVLHVFSDILAAVDRGDFAALVLLDLSAAFDTVDHGILLERLQRSFGIDGDVHHWLASYLTGRSQCVRRGSIVSSSTTLECGVPQGSVLGPLLFILYTADLPDVIEQHGLTPHLYADDSQICGFCRPGDAAALSDRLTRCVDAVAIWMRNNRLQLNVGKTDFLWCTTTRQVHQLPTWPLSLDGHDVTPSSSVRDLGVIIDSDLRLRRHIDIVVARCFAALRQLRSIRRYVTVPVMRSLVTSLVLTRLDYCNSILVGQPATQLRRLQSVQNAAARTIFNLRRSDHVSDALYCLHWLRIPERIRFKMAVLTYRALHGQSPTYLSRFVSLSAQPRRPGLRSASSQQLSIPRTRLTTIGDRAFPVAGAAVWNDLPLTVTSSLSLPAFRSRLKTFLFSSSHPGFV